MRGDRSARGRSSWWLPYGLVVIPFALLLLFSFRRLHFVLVQERLEAVRQRTARLSSVAGRLEQTFSRQRTSLTSRLATLDMSSDLISDPLDRGLDAPAWVVAAVVRDPKGRVCPTLSREHVAYAHGGCPPVPSASGLAAAEELEFALGKPKEAARVYQQEALTSDSNTVAAAALMGLIRCQRKVGEFRESMENAGRLDHLFGRVVGPSGIPYGLASAELHLETLTCLASIGGLKSTDQPTRQLVALLRDLACNRYALDRKTLLSQRAIANDLSDRLVRELARSGTDPESLRTRVSFWSSPFAQDLVRLVSAWPPNLGDLTVNGLDYRIVSANDSMNGRSAILVIHPEHLAGELRKRIDEGMTLRASKEGLALGFLPGYSLSLVSGEAEGPIELPYGAFVFLGILGLLATTGLVLAAGQTRAALDLANDRSVFLARFTHELKTPLASIRLLTERAKSGAGDDDGQVERRFGLITGEAARLERLLGNVLAYSKDLFRSTLRAPVFEPCDLDELVEDALSLVRPALGRRRIEYQPSEEPLVIDGDRDALVRVVLNVVANAARFGPEEDVIDVTTGPAADKVVLLVRDRGPGVAPSERDSIFEPFVQGSSRCESSAGLGLGLHISRLILERHGGRISVADPPEGAGAVFRIELPRYSRTKESIG